MSDKPNYIQELTQYLLDHSDEDGDGIPGWGLMFAWDAFQDGSINPVGQVYAIEVANVLDALMDALDSGCLNDDQAGDVKKIIRQVTLEWNNKYWTDKNDSGESFYWYSTSPDDEIESVNISAKLAGVFARALHNYPELFTSDEMQLICNNVDSSIERILSVASYQDDVITWPYLTRSSSPNDCIHHAFILEGLSDYQTYRGVVNYDMTDYNAYINSCVAEEWIYSTPEHDSSRCFDSDAVRWLGDMVLQERVLLSCVKEYLSGDTDIRQLAFLLHALSSWISSNN